MEKGRARPRGGCAYRRMPNAHGRAGSPAVHLGPDDGVVGKPMGWRTDAPRSIDGTLRRLVRFGFRAQFSATAAVPRSVAPFTSRHAFCDWRLVDAVVGLGQPPRPGVPHASVGLGTFVSTRAILDFVVLPWRDGAGAGALGCGSMAPTSCVPAHAGAVRKPAAGPG